VGREAPIALPLTRAEIKVGGFAKLERRIRTGERIFDEVLADRAAREAIFAWAMARPHTGARAITGDARAARDTVTLREVWPVPRVKALSPVVHAAPEPDPAWP